MLYSAMLQFHQCLQLYRLILERQLRPEISLLKTTHALLTHIYIFFRTAEMDMFFVKTDFHLHQPGDEFLRIGGGKCTINQC